MNAGSPNTGSSGMSLKPIIGIIVLILVLVGFYYLYQFLYGKNPAYGAVSILSGNISMSKTVNEPVSGLPVVSVSEVSGVLDGGEYTVNFWIYVADTKGFGGAAGARLAHLMEISDRRFLATGSTATRGKTLIFVGLNPVNGSLVVRQSTSDQNEEINNSVTSGSGNATRYPLNDLLTGYTTGTTYQSDDRCDILNGIEYQRWVQVTCVGNGRTLDVYIDGKLARSCVYRGGFALSSTTGKAQAFFGLDNGGNLKGFFSNGTFYNYALTPDAIWASYQAGPGGTFSITDFFKNLFNVNVSFSASSNLNA